MLGEPVCSDGLRPGLQTLGEPAHDAPRRCPRLRHFESPPDPLPIRALTFLGEPRIEHGIGQEVLLDQSTGAASPLEVGLPGRLAWKTLQKGRESPLEVHFREGRVFLVQQGFERLQVDELLNLTLDGDPDVLGLSGAEAALDFLNLRIDYGRVDPGADGLELGLVAFDLLLTAANMDQEDRQPHRMTAHGHT